LDRTRVAVVTVGSTAAVVFAYLALAGVNDRVPDDAFIVLVYARHLAEHGQIYWNAADGHVDGYTSFLDMALKALGTKLFPASDPIAMAHVSTLFFHGATVALGAAFAYRAARTAPGEPAVPVKTWGAIGTLGALAFASNLAFAAGSGFLLETSLYAATALVALGLLLFAPLVESRAARVALGVSWLLLALARPEGGPLAVLQAAAFVLSFRGRLTRRELAVPCAILGVGLAAYYAWHLRYFGWWAPNTYYAKSSDSRWLEVKDGVGYLGLYLAPGARAIVHVLLAAVPLLVFVRGAWERDEDRRRFAIVSALGLAAVAEVVYEGGDGYSNGRFLAVPILYLVATAVCGAAWARGRFRFAPAAALALFVLEAMWRVAPHQEQRLKRIAAWPMTVDKSDTRCDVAPMKLLEARVADMSQTDMQRAKLFADRLRVIDLMGLNDMRRAHEPTPGQDLWGKGGPSPAAPRENAEVMQLGIRTNLRFPMAAHTTEEIVREPALSVGFFGYTLSRETQDEILARYVPLSIPTACGTFLNMFVRADVADRFAGDRVLVGRAR
jgi:hypothetical protein